MSRKRRRKKKPYKSLLLMLLLACLVTSFLFLGGSDFFDITRITVEGAVSLSSEEIIEASGIRIGDNIFRFSAKDAESAIKALQNIKNASVVRVYPNKVKLIVLERSAFVSVSFGGTYYVYDDENLKISETKNISEAGGLIISGMTDNSLLLSDVLDSSSSAILATAFEIAFWQQQNNLHGSITEIYISPSGYYYAYTKNSNIIKFYTLAAFDSNKEFIKDYLLYEDRHIMVEVVEDSEPVYKVIQIN